MLAEIHNKSYEDFVRYTILANKQIVESGTNQDFNKVLKTLVNDIKVFSLTEEIKNILTETKNHIREKPLPFHDIFVDVNFFSEKITIQGIWMGDRFSTQTTRGFPIGEKLIRFYLNYFGDKDKKGFWMSVSIPLFADCKGFWKERLKKEISEDDRDENLKKLNEKELLNLFKRIQLFANNFLDFLNHPDIETKVMKWHNNEKRISRGQNPIPDRVSINVKGKLYRYIYEDIPDQQKSSPKNSFWVRGHYIHFWNQKRYNRLYNLEQGKLEEKGYYKDKQGIVCKWVLPYIKGRGEVKKKDYKLKQRGGRR